MFINDMFESLFHLEFLKIKEMYLDFTVLKKAHNICNLCPISDIQLWYL